MDSNLLEKIHLTSGAGYCSGNRQGCLRGTRGGVLLQLEHWLKDGQDHRVFWLNGLAGTGKSTIAQTFAEISFADGKLGASFFCSRDFEDRSNLQVIFPTLAFQLAYRYPLFREQLLQVLRATPDLRHESLCSQMEKVIVGPFKATQISTLIIIDALDECKDKEPASALLSILSRYVNEVPHVKFFITGRPEPRIRSGFRLASLHPITEVLRLHDVEPSLVDEDIKLFFRTQLANISKTRSDCDLTEEWPSSHDINILCKKAAGLFIYASTVTKFIASQHYLPTERLALIVSLPQCTTYEGRLEIDLLYTKVLEQAFLDADSDNQELYSNFRSVVGTVLLLFNPLPMKGLSTLLRTSNTSTPLRFLYSVLQLPSNEDNSIQVFHKSFPDFLMDQGRCQDERFFINPSVHHQEILLSCLNLMKERLRRNICGLDDYTVLRGVEDLSTRQKTHIGGALEYACCFWTRHLVNTSGSGQVQKAVDEVFTTHLLFWIEVLIILGKLDTGVHAINEVQQWYISVSCQWLLGKVFVNVFVQAGFICQWAGDSQHFILEHYDAIHNSPSQIYHSALPLSPSKSWLYGQYCSELSQEVKVVKGLQTEWGACSHTVSLEHNSKTLVHWKDLIAVGSKSGNIITLDAATGICTSILSGHTDRVLCLAFSSDGTFLVSGSLDETIKLWDIQTGGVVKTSDHTSQTHTVVTIEHSTATAYANQISSVSISQDHSTIASGSSSKIHLWDTWTGVCYCVIDGLSDTNSVAFSPINSKLLISTSISGMQQWDLDGHQIGPTYEGFYVAFSLDGAQFISWGNEVSRVQNSNSGVVVNTIYCHYQCCCFSPDGNLVACATYHTIDIWDITSSHSHLIKSLTGLSSSSTSPHLTFSSFLISSFSSESIQFWHIGTPLSGLVTTGLKPTQHVSVSFLSFLTTSIMWKLTNFWRIGTSPFFSFLTSSFMRKLIKSWHIGTSSLGLVTTGSESTVSIQSVSLQANRGTAASLDSAGVVRTWDISTGQCKASFHIPMPDTGTYDIQLIEGRLIAIWAGEEIRIWDVEKEEALCVVHTAHEFHSSTPRISRDGSKVFLWSDSCIQVWSTWTGKSLGTVELEGTEEQQKALFWDLVHGSRVWPYCGNSQPQRWDLGVSGSAPIPLSNELQDRPYLDLIKHTKIKDVTTGKVVFQLSGRYARPNATWWDHQYFIAGYGSGEVLILDFSHLTPQ